MSKHTSTDTSTAAKETQKAATKNLPEVSTVNLFAARQQKLAVKKREIAAIASSLTEDPEKYVCVRLGWSYKTYNV